MRVISGSARGVKLNTIEGLETRPTTDRVKESIFNLIQFNVQRANVLDLFSGSGALGIEAASRGAEKVFLIEKDMNCHNVIQSNLINTKLTDKVTLIKSGVISGLKRLNERFDVIIMDPPYGMNHVEPVMNSIQENSLLAENGIILVEHGIDDSLPEKIGIFSRIRQKKYGKTLISIYGYEE